ncbi:MAG: 1,4-dihydroxy-6-naphthoate synthase [Pseudopedobacter saltans]|uniref:1,4-dihydroxy-6-naphtoate synthase n=1 Tax=Pseudopedobacter saltans TaxID=151895 RepID=A0A2W5FC62_9SPHI|nr:MAG: 1,4-dihydroxy-6-naphthoate synthase [Pseudopedobacter saltans]
MKFSLGFSPCPNDTFIFDALVNKKIDTEGIDFDIELDDVQTLNNWAKEGKLDFSKISYGALPQLLSQYAVLESGGALGVGVGPLLLAKESIDLKEVDTYKIAIPGKDTTAHMLFSLAFPHANNKEFVVFNEVEDYVLDGKGLGVIIHENRFTYQKRGLHKLIDLGDYWEKTTGAPIPLGGIIAKRTLPKDVILQVDKLINKSIAYAFENHKEHLAEFVKIHAQEMEESVMRQHIDLYVNDFSLGLGEKGKKAIDKVLDVYQQLHPENTIDRTKIFAKDL